MEAAEQEALLREVDEAVRQGDAQDFLARWGKPLFGLIILLIAAFGGYIYWESRQEAAREKHSETLVTALDQVQAGNLDSGYKSLEELAASDEDAASAAAAMLRAGISAQRNKPEEAAKIFGQVAADESAPLALRELAKVREVALKYDNMDSAKVISELKPLAVPGKPYFASAGELVAHAYLDQDKRDEAGALFAQIAKDKSAPESLRSRARQMAGVLGVDAIVDVDKVLEEQGVDREAADATAQTQ